ERSYHCSSPPREYNRREASEDPQGRDSMFRTIGTCIVLAAVVLCIRSKGEPKVDPAAPAETLEGRFASQVRPFLHRYCISCHGGKNPKAMFDRSCDSTLS